MNMKKQIWRNESEEWNQNKSEETNLKIQYEET